jgi:hypothetical protein
MVAWGRFGHRRRPAAMEELGATFKILSSSMMEASWPLRLSAGKAATTQPLVRRLFISNAGA